jgi:ubiquinone/menaquinone biosynthesis C-methylase UbiE
MIGADWQEKVFCERYSSERELSTSEVHFGWFAPGDAKLGLTEDLTPGQNVLDVGCGSGENLIALAKRGARAYGIDISKHMLEIARRNFQKEFNRSHDIQLEQQRVEEFSAFEGVQFDLILFVYSMEYLHSLVEFREVVTNLYRRLNDGGKLLICFSHPSQHNAHATLLNYTAFASTDEESHLIYSFVGPIEIFHTVGFEIERVIEQSTKAPSRISYQESQHFPYRFAEGLNPCVAEYDHISEASAHTVIYSLRKPLRHFADESSVMRIIPGSQDKTRIWGVNRSVTKTEKIRSNQRLFDVISVAPYDSLVAYAVVTSFVFDKDVIAQSKSERARIVGRPDLRSFGLLNHVDQVLREDGLTPEYGSRFTSTKSLESHYIREIDPLHDQLVELFPRGEIGVLIFVNDLEPAGGTINMDGYVPVKGDRVDVVYIVSGWGQEWRQRRNVPPSNQLSFSDFK